MAVEKNGTTAAKSENIEKAENAGNEVQTHPQAAKKEPETVKFIYIGPSLPKAMLKSNTVFEGTKEEIKKELAAVLERFPLVEHLLVPVEKLG